MIPLYTNQEYENAKSEDLLKFKCEKCGNEFYEPKKWVKMCLTHETHSGRIRFCSQKCWHEFTNKSLKMQCENCGVEITISYRDYIKSKSGHFFCSRSCSATYNNTHKQYGTRRSKIEKYIEKELSELYPTMEILYNDKSAIFSELDIYIPSLKLAFELNGIFHYEPIFGDKKLKNVQINDNNKFQLCQKNKISLCTIDISELKYFKEKNAKKYLDIITEIINQEINRKLA